MIRKCVKQQLNFDYVPNSCIVQPQQQQCAVDIINCNSFAQDMIRPFDFGIQYISHPPSLYLRTVRVHCTCTSGTSDSVHCVQMRVMMMPINSHKHVPYFNSFVHHVYLFTATIVRGSTCTFQTHNALPPFHDSHF